MKKITLLFAFLLAFAADSYAQFPEGFEGESFPPPGWTTFRGTNGAGTEYDWEQADYYAHSGDYHAYISYEGSGEVNEDWLVTPQFTVSASTPALQFYQLQTYIDDYGSIYEIRVSTTSQTDHASFTTVLSQTEADLSYEDYTAKLVDLSAYIGQQIYVAFVMINDEGDDWLIDDVDMVELVSAPGCASNPSPVDAAVDVEAGVLTFTWDAPTTGGAPTSYDMYAGIDPGDVTNLVGNFPTNSAEISLSDYGTTFYWTIVPKNAAGSATGCDVWSFTVQDPPGYCLSAPWGLYPNDEAGFTPDTCDGVTQNVIVNNAWAGEYSLVNVTSGETYVFTSGTSDFVTIGATDSNTALAYGETPLTWVSTVTGQIKFFSHVDDQCGDEDVNRTRSVVCGTPSVEFPDYVGLQWPQTATIDEGDTVMVYGQIYEEGVTNPAGQGADIQAWVGVNDANTDPSTWSEDAWSEMTYNASCGDCGNNDEYMGAIGDGLEAGTYYYAVRFRLGEGLFAYGGREDGGAGNFWDGTQYISGVLTVNPPAAPANDECEGAIALTPGGDFATGALTTTNLGATSADPASCQTDSDESVWYSVVVPASGNLTIETGDVDGSVFNDSVVTVYSGTCGSLTEIECDDDDSVNGLFSLIELTGRTPGETLYISVWRYNGLFAGGDWGEFQISAYDESLGNDQFNSNNFAVYPNPVKSVLNLNSTLADISNVAVYNLLGQQVIAKRVNASEGQIDMSALPTGTYMVKITANNQVKTVKVIKE